jgi:valyl-tRNA synthetase
MRMALCASATQAREIDLDLRRFEEFKNFANKIWNGARFVFMNLEGDAKQGTTPLSSEELSEGLNESLFSLEDRWILSTLARTVRDVNTKLGTYLFDQAALEAYDFFWKEFCSYYVEIAKPVLTGKAGTAEERKNKQKILVIVLCQALRLIHPMAPYITEELFQKIKERFAGITHIAKDPYSIDLCESLSCPSCMVASYPRILEEKALNPEIEVAFKQVSSVVYAIRNIRGEMKIPPNTATDVHIVGSPTDALYKIVEDNQAIITALVRINTLTLHTQEPALGFASTGVIDNLKIFIPLPAEMLKQEKARLAKEKERLLLSIEKMNVQLNNPEFVNNAPAPLVEKQQNQLRTSQRELAEVEAKLMTFAE